MKRIELLWGDIFVRCISDYAISHIGLLTLGKIYKTTLPCELTKGSGLYGYEITCDNGSKHWYFSERFEEIPNKEFEYL